MAGWDVGCQRSWSRSLVSVSLLAVWVTAKLLPFRMLRFGFTLSQLRSIWNLLCCDRGWGNKESKESRAIVNYKFLCFLLKHYPLRSSLHLSTYILREVVECSTWECNRGYCRKILIYQTSKHSCGNLQLWSNCEKWKSHSREIRAMHHFCLSSITSKMPVVPHLSSREFIWYEPNLKQDKNWKFFQSCKYFRIFVCILLPQNWKKWLKNLRCNMSYRLVEPKSAS